jgi:hypothetical protein
MGGLQQLLSIRREELAPSGHQRSERSEKYLAKLRRDLDLGVLAWIRRRNAKRLGDKAVAGKEPSPLWWYDFWYILTKDPIV